MRLDLNKNFISGKNAGKMDSVADSICFGKLLQWPLLRSLTDQGQFAARHVFHGLQQKPMPFQRNEPRHINHSKALLTTVTQTAALR